MELGNKNQIDIVGKLMVESVKKNTGLDWVSVKKKLPEKNVDVEIKGYIDTTNSLGFFEYWIAWLSPNGWCKYDKNNEERYLDAGAVVTDWRPIPEKRKK